MCPLRRVVTRSFMWGAYFVARRPLSRDETIEQHHERGTRVYFEQQYIQPLSKVKKEQLIRDVQRMLVDEEIAQHGGQMLRDMAPPGTMAPI